MPDYKPRRWLPASLLGLTWITVTGVGARLQYNFNLLRPPYHSNNDLFPFLWLWRHPHEFFLGLPFSTTLLGILMAHEWGHFWACRRHALAASYPHFLPAPSLLGTFGAFIRIHSPFENRRALLDVGMAGPLAGIALAVPLFYWGALGSVTRSYASTANAFHFGWPRLAQVLLALAHPSWGDGKVYLSPMARAAWFGFLATMLNLLPIGQFDGGHILYAFLPRQHRWVSFALIGLLLVAGWRIWQGWLIWGAMGLAMRGRHPYVPDTGEKLGWLRIALAMVCLGVALATFVIRPVWTT